MDHLRKQHEGIEDFGRGDFVGGFCDWKAMLYYDLRFDTMVRRLKETAEPVNPPIKARGVFLEDKKHSPQSQALGPALALEDSLHVKFTHLARVSALF